MKIIAFSDPHGILPKIEESFDLMLVGGDIVGLREQSSMLYSKGWFQEVFVPWVNSLPFKEVYSKVIFIAGNHDALLENEGKDSPWLYSDVIRQCNGRLIYLENESYTFEYIENEEVKSITIFGTPYCKVFGRWSFMQRDDELRKTFSEIPENIDILLTHDAPYGTSDLCYGWHAWGRTPYHIGNESLRDAIIEKKPKINLHGHLHSANHNAELLEETQVINISLVDESYDPTYTPLIFEWPVTELLHN